MENEIQNHHHELQFYWEEKVFRRKCFDRINKTYDVDATMLHFDVENDSIFD